MMRLNAIQLFTNTAIMMSILFIPLIASDFGASGTEIGIIGAVYGLSLFVSTYIFSRASDSVPPKTLLYAGLVSSAITFFLQILADDPLSLGIIRAAAGFSAGVYPAALILYVFRSKRSIGKFISYMPLGWAIGFFAAGIIAVYWQIFAISSLLFAISFFITLTLPDMEVSIKKKPEYFSSDVFYRNWKIYLAFFLRQTGANNVWIIFPLYLTSLGANELWIGMIYMINPVLQFFIIRRLDKYSNRFLINTGYFISAIAFAAFLPLTVHYQAISGMILIAISFSCLYVGSTKELIEKNEDKGTSAGLLNSMFSLSMVIGSLVGGGILEHYGFQAVITGGVLFSITGYMVLLFGFNWSGRS